MSKVPKYIKGLEEGKYKMEAALDAGYSEATAKNAKHIIETRKEFKELMAEYLPEDTLLAKHKELLASDNENIAAKALDMGYKLNNKYTDRAQVNVNILNMSGVLDQLEEGE